MNLNWKSFEAFHLRIDGNWDATKDADKLLPSSRNFDLILKASTKVFNKNLNNFKIFQSIQKLIKYFPLQQQSAAFSSASRKRFSRSPSTCCCTVPATFPSGFNLISAFWWVETVNRSKNIFWLFSPNRRSSSWTIWRNRTRRTVRASCSCRFWWRSSERRNSRRSSRSSNIFINAKTKQGEKLERLNEDAKRVEIFF